MLGRERYAGASIREVAGWRVRSHPNFVGPASSGTVAPIQVLHEELELTLPEAKSLIDRAVFDAEVVRVLVESQQRPELVAKRLNDSAPGILSAWVEPQQ